MSNGAANGFLWTSLGLVGPLAARVSGTAARRHTGISIDTHTLQKGDLFAIKGPSSDGHDYVGAAFKRAPSRRWSM